MAIRWGIDLGGTKIEGVVIDDRNVSSPLCRIRIPTFPMGDQGKKKSYEGILTRIEELVNRMQRETGLHPERIGFATPGAIDPRTGTMRNCNTTVLNTRPLAGDLSHLLGLPVVLENDANCFALAEACFGAGRGAPVVFGVIMGTGVGGGVVIGGKTLPGLQGIAGEWGHNVLDPLGLQCYCGKRGCVETVISGPALEHWYQSHAGQTKALADIIRDAHTGADGVAQDVVRHLCSSFGKALSVVINILDPHVVVLGGGVSNVSALYDQGVAELKKNVFNTRLETVVVKNQLGDSAGVFGAALL